MAGVVGPILGAFGKTKTIQQQYNDQLGKTITGAASGAQANRALNDADLARYATASQQAAGRVEGLLGQDNTTLGSLIAKGASYDPMAAYRGIGDYQTSILDRLAGSLANRGKASQNLAEARMGYGGRGGSTYTQNALIDRLSGNLAPAYASVLGNIGRDTQVLSGQGIANMANAANLISQRQNAQGAPATYYLNPALARSQLQGEEAQNLGLLGQAAKGNTAGFRTEKGFVGRLAEGIEEAEGTILNTAMSVLSMYPGGGMGGMMGGGGGGAKKPQAPAGPQFTPTYSPPVDFGSSGGYYGGGFGYSQPSGGTLSSYGGQQFPATGGYLNGGIGYQYRPGV
jgi:hypothetical protein